MIGAALFGLGWGLGGLCPGPGMINFFVMTHMIIWLPALAAGQIGFELAHKGLEKYKAGRVENSGSAESDSRKINK